MRVTVTDDDGVEEYVYDTSVDGKIVFPGVRDRQRIGEALEDALNFLRSGPNGENGEPNDETETD